MVPSSRDPPPASLDPPPSTRNPHPSTRNLHPSPRNPDPSPFAPILPLANCGRCSTGSRRALSSTRKRSMSMRSTRCPLRWARVRRSWLRGSRPRRLRQQPPLTTLLRASQMRHRRPRQTPPPSRHQTPPPSRRQTATPGAGRSESVLAALRPDCPPELMAAPGAEKRRKRGWSWGMGWGASPHGERVTWRERGAEPEGVGGGGARQSSLHRSLAVLPQPHPLSLPQVAR
eukprot:7389210-Prymnesium_polylepis.1